MGAVSRQGSLLLMAFLIHTVISAPVIEDNTDLLSPDQIAEGNGCYYNYEHYEEGDRIVTNEPCLNCTCHNRMLMCYLRVCPFTKAIGQDCKIEKKPDQCCPVITCPQGTTDNMPVALLTSSTTETTTATALGHPDRYGCLLDDNAFYPDGAQVPSDSRKPCELCYCIRNHTACVMQECTLNVEGCKPVYQEGVCCPVRYDCDYDNVPTTPKPTVGLITSPEGPAECNVNGKLYYDGELIDNMTSNPCEHCYCMRGEVVCAVQECGSPLEHTECTPMPAEPGQCCPSTYQCPNGTVPAQALQSEPKPDKESLLVTEKSKVENAVEENTGQPEADPEGTTQRSSSNYLSGAHSLDDAEGHEDSEHEPKPEHDESVSTDTAAGAQIDQTSEQPKEQAIIEIITTAGPGDAQEGTTVPSERLQEAEPKPETTNGDAKPDEIAAAHDQEEGHIEQDPVEKYHVEQDLFEGEEHHEEHQEGHDAEVTTIPGHYTEISVENVEMNTSPPETSKPAENPAESDGTNIVEPAEDIPSGAHSLDEGHVTGSADQQEAAPTTEASKETHEAPQETNEAPKETYEAPQETSEAPKETYEAPQETNETPQEINETPQETNEANKEEEKPAAAVASDVIETTPAPIATSTTSSPPEPEELPRIPGEGSCLYKGITYAPNTDVPSPENCKRCRCINSIIECGEVECPEPPISLYSNCVPMPPTDDTCCPTYFCEQKPSQEPEAENHLSIDKIDEGIHDEEVGPTMAPSAAEDQTTLSSGDAQVPGQLPTGAHDLGGDSVSQQSLDVPQGVELDHPAEDLTETENHLGGANAVAYPDDPQPQTEGPAEQVTSKSSAAQETTQGQIEGETPSPLQEEQTGLQHHSQDTDLQVPIEEQAPAELSPEVPTTEKPAEPSASDIPSGAHDLGESTPDKLSPQVEMDPSTHGEGMGSEEDAPASTNEDLPQTTATPASEQEATNSQASAGAPIQAEDLPQTSASDSGALSTEKPVDSADVPVPSASGNAVNRGEYATEFEPEALATEIPQKQTPQQESDTQESQHTNDASALAPEGAPIDGEQHIETSTAPLAGGNELPNSETPEVQQAPEGGVHDSQESASAGASSIPENISTYSPSQQETTSQPQITSDHDSIPSESTHPNELEQIPSFDAQENAVDDHLETELGPTAEAELEVAATSSPQAPQTEGPSGVTDGPEELVPLITTGPPVLFPDIGHQGAPIHVPGPEGISQENAPDISGDRNLLDGERLGETESPAEETITTGSPVSAGAVSIPEPSASEEPQVNEELSITTEGAKPQLATGSATNEVSQDGQEADNFSAGDNQIGESSHTPEMGVQEGANEISPAESEDIPAGAHSLEEPAKEPEVTQEASTEAAQSVTEGLAETEQEAIAHNEDEPHPAEGLHDETHPAEGLHNEMKPAEGVHDEMQPAEGVHDEMEPAKGVHDDTHPAEGTDDETHPAEGVHEEIHPAEGVHIEVQPAEGVHDGMQPAEGVNNESNPVEGAHDATQPAEGAHDATQPAEGTHDGTQPAEGAHDGNNPLDATSEPIGSSAAAEQGTPEPEISETETPTPPIVTHGDLPDQPYLSGAHALDDKLPTPDEAVEEERQPEGTAPGQHAEFAESATQPSSASAQEVASENAGSEPAPSEATTTGPERDEVITHVDSAGPQKVPEIANQIVEPNLNAIEHSSADEHPFEVGHDTTGQDQDQTAPENDVHEIAMIEQTTVAVTEEPQKPQSTPEEPAHQTPEEHLLPESEIQKHDHIAEHIEGPAHQEHTPEPVSEEPQPEGTGEHIEQTTQKEEATSDGQSESIQAPGSGSANVAEDHPEQTVHHDGEGAIHEEEEEQLSLTHNVETAESASGHVPIDSASAASQPDETAEEEQAQTTSKPTSEPALTSVPEEPTPQVDQAEAHQTAPENLGELPSPPEQYEEPTAAPEHHEEQTTLHEVDEEQPTAPEHHEDLPIAPEQHSEPQSIPESHGEQPTAPEHHEEQPALMGESLGENAQAGTELPGEGESPVTGPAQTSAPYLSGAHDLGEEMGQTHQPAAESHTEAVQPSQPEHVESTDQAESQTSPSEVGSVQSGPESSLDHAEAVESQPDVSEGAGLGEAEAPSEAVSAPEGALIDSVASAPSAPELDPSAPESPQEHPEAAPEQLLVPELTAPDTSPEEPSATGLVSATAPETAPEESSAPELASITVPEIAPEEPSAPGSVSATVPDTSPEESLAPGLSSATAPDTAPELASETVSESAPEELPAPGLASASAPETAPEQQAPLGDNLESPTSPGSAASQPDQSSHLPEENEKVPESSSSPLSQLSSSPSLPVELPTTEGPALPPALQNWSQKPYHPPSEHQTHPEPPQMPEDSHYPSPPFDQDYEDEDSISYGPGTCRYGGKVYLSAQQIPRDDPCDFCFCFRSDIICLQQSCPPPIKGCYQETIKGFCCPRYECHVSMATMVNITTTSTTTTTTVPPHFLSHHYSGAARKAGCQVKGVAYAVGDSIPSTSGPCLDCRCGADGQMKCDPTNCGPQESLLRQVMAASVTKRRRR